MTWGYLQVKALVVPYQGMPILLEFNDQKKTDA
jgi:hypothetical protein